ncbi:MAG: hypothetical protein AB7U38_10405 [Hyphomicrobiales bacterium]
MRIPLNSPAVIPLDMSKVELRKIPDEDMARIREALGNMAGPRGTGRIAPQQATAGIKGDGGAGGVTDQGSARGGMVTPTGPSAFTARTLAALMTLNEV